MYGQQVTQKMTWTPDLKMTERQIEKESLQRQLTKRIYAAIVHIRLDKLPTREIQK
ncbi:MAG: hypothetical protein ACI4KF_08460 [Huintestinicola sp.]